MEKSFLILPGCDDRNRGDQALIWETITLAKNAGYDGKYLMLSKAEGSEQSRKMGIENVPYILEHPSVKFKQTDNIKYTLGLRIKWGLSAIIDIISREPLMNRRIRNIVRHLLKESVQRSLQVFDSVDACFVKGGGFLHSYGGMAETYKIYYFLYHIRLALSMGKPVYVLPNSFGPFKSPFVKGMIHRTLSKCNIVMSRERISQNQLMSDCGVASHLFADIAFHLQSDDSFDVKKELREKNILVEEQKCVAITARPYRFLGCPNHEELYQTYKNSLVKVVEWLSDNGYFPVFVEHVFDEKGHENDMNCISEIIACLKKTCKYGLYSNRSLNCSQIKKVYGEFEYLIGTRFHSVIFSLAQGVPAIAITYGGNKGLGIMQDLGLEDYAVPISSVTGDDLIQKFKTLVDRNNQVRKTIQDMLPRLTAQKDSIEQLLKGL